MNRDPLANLSSALREEWDGTSPTALMSRRRILVQVAQTQKRKRRLLSFLVPPLLVLGASSAWAQATGRMPAALGAIGQLVSAALNGTISDANVDRPSSSPRPRVVRKSVTETAPAALDQPLPSDQAPAPAASALETTAPPERGDFAPQVQPSLSPVQSLRPKVPDLSGTAGRRRDGTSPHGPNGPDGSGVAALGSPTLASPRATAAAENVALRLYRRAQDAHFKAGDCAQALALYNQYLGEVARGGFRAEAAYHRAVCLVRLGRQAEAQNALEPFARGGYGSYRQAEASALLVALQNSTPQHSEVNP